MGEEKEGLKTLKDLEKETNLTAQEYGDSSYWAENLASDLRQEAIKWIKEHRKNLSDFPFASKFGYSEGEGWFKNFFNLTEEDLKEGKK